MKKIFDAVRIFCPIFDVSDVYNGLFDLPSSRRTSEKTF